MKKQISKQVKKIYHAIFWRHYFPNVYKKEIINPIQKGKIVFVEQQNDKTLSNNFHLLHQELISNDYYNVCVHCLGEGVCGAWEYIRRARKALQDIATAEVVFLCEGSRLISCVDMRAETKVAQVWHGCGAFKKFGFSTAELLFGKELKESEQYSYYENYDIVTVSSEAVVWAYQEAMNLPADSSIVKPIGLSRTDVFFDQAFIDNARRRIEEQIPKIKDKKVILYAPTFRGSVGKAKAPDELDLKRMKEKLADEYVLLIKHHPTIKERPSIDAELADFAFDVSASCEIDDLICVSDICISDYSSLVFEYSLMERPMIFFAYDLENYEDWRGFYYDYQELTPGAVVKTTEEILCQIDNIANYDLKQIQDFKEKFMSACDGESTKRLLEYLKLK